ncbi:MAG: SAM-dependent methyltransferase, partial [Proteobacteria bacterium]
MSWREFWNADNPIYVSERHQRLHCRRVADDTIALVGDLCPAPGRARVLDFGCGKALEAARVAE